MDRKLSKSAASLEGTINNLIGEARKNTPAMFKGTFDKSVLPALNTLKDALVWQQTEIDCLKQTTALHTQDLSHLIGGEK